MFKLKKTTAVITATACICLCFGGCTGKLGKSDSNTISWYMPKSIDNMKDQELVEKTANKITNEKLGVNLKFHLIDNSSYNDKMNVIISSGENYDICFTSSWSNNYLQNIKKNAFLDISGLLNQYGKDIIAKSDSRIINAMTSNGKIYAIPSQMPIATLRSRVLKKDLVEKYSFDYENTQKLSDLEPFLEQIKQNEPGIIPILAMSNIMLTDEDDQQYNDDSISVLRYSEKAGKYVKYFEIPEVVERYRTINKFYKKGYIAKDAATQKDFMSEAKSGKYAVLNNTGYYTKDAVKSSTAYGFECVETYLGEDIITTPGIMTSLNAIGRNTKQPEKSMQLLNLIWQDTTLSNTLAYGVEGINYSVDKDREIFSVIPNSGKEQTWAVWHNWLGPLWDQWDSPWNRVEALEEMKTVNDRAKASGSFGFVFDSDPVKSEMAQLTSVYNEIIPIFNTGSMPDFDEYLANANKKLEIVQIDKVLEEVNRQLPDWKKTK